MTTISLILASCASSQGFPERVISPEEELQGLKKYFHAEKVDEYNNPSRTDEERKRIRNEIINARLAAIDIQFSLFQQELHREGVGLNIGTDAIVLGLGAAGALVSGGTSQVLSATSAAVTGLKGSVDKKVFFEQTMPALFAQMIAKRKSVLVNIRTGLLQSVSLYPLQQGIADVEEYRYSGTIPGAISSVIENAGAQSAEAGEQLSEIIKTGFEVTDDTLALKQWLKPGGVRNRERWDILQRWLDSNNVHMSVASFMDAPEMRVQIKQAIDYLKTQRLM
ncbi:MAG TPA: hypothetical protein VI457_03335 [Methylococcaceae bacterium]|nr:hypothetical protein [Methylococcaceae bacterium]